MDSQFLDKLSCLDLGSPPSVGPQTFPFFDLPPELRVKIYSLVLFDPKQKRLRRREQQSQFFPLQRIHILIVCKRFHTEAAHCLYSSLAFRIFPLQDYSRIPAVIDIPSLQYKRSIRSLQIALGSSWTHPPRSWKVDEKLGLHHMDRVHTLEIFVQCDPSHPVFEGFRVSKGFYTGYAGALLKEVLGVLPSLRWVQFDGNPSVEKSGDLMTRLISEVSKSGKKILWGPARGWKD